MRRAAIRTAARIARFSIVTLSAAGSASGDELDVRRRELPGRRVGLAQARARAVATDGAPDLTAHVEAHASRAGAHAPQHDHRGPLDSLTLLKERLKLGAHGEPLGP